MCQAEQCFSPRLAAELKGLKRRLAAIRMPFAKQELPGRPAPVRGEPSIYGIGDSPPDLRFEVKGQVISVRELIGEFDRVFGGITKADVLADHRTTYSPGAALGACVQVAEPSYGLSDLNKNNADGAGVD
jgi:hypothetical protein